MYPSANSVTVRTLTKAHSVTAVYSAVEQAQNHCQVGGLALQVIPAARRPRRRSGRAAVSQPHDAGHCGRGGSHSMRRQCRDDGLSRGRQGWWVSLKAQQTAGEDHADATDALGHPFGACYLENCEEFIVATRTSAGSSWKLTCQISTHGVSLRLRADVAVPRNFGANTTLDDRERLAPGNSQKHPSTKTATRGRKGPDRARG
jgi:hypothetical protein